MKRARKTKIFLFLTVVAAVLAVVCISAPPKNAEEPPAVIEAGKNIENAIICRGEISPVETYLERSDLAVRGRYEGTTKGFPLIADGMPMQFHKFTVEEIYKGECGDEIVYVSPGGEVHLKDFLTSAAENGILAEKVGAPLKWLDLVQEQYPDLNVIYRCHISEAFPFIPEEGQEYLAFFKWVSLGEGDRGVYFLDSAWDVKPYSALGMRKINEDGLVLNPCTKNYETISFMEKHETE